MERDAHYFAVGLFVIVTLVAGFFFTDLFTERSDQEQTPYIIHFTQPVDGLAAGNEVRFMGVKVGEVAAVGLKGKSENSAVRVEVVIKVLSETPLNTATVAVLRTQILTGLPFLNLLQSEKTDEIKSLVTSTVAPAIIPTQLSDIDSVLTRLPGLENRLDQVLASVEDLLNPTNREVFAGLLQNLEKSSAEVPPLLKRLQQTSEQFTVTAKSADQLLTSLGDELDQGASGLNKTLKAIRQTSGSIGKLATSLTRTSDRLNITARDVGGAVNKVGNGMNNSMEHLNQTLQAIRRTALELRNLTEVLEQDPSRVIYQSSPQGIELRR